MDIFEAAKNGNIDRIKELLEEGVDINVQNEKGFTALMSASSWSNLNSNDETVKFLLENGADINIQTFTGKWTALMSAVRYIGDSANSNGNSNNETVKTLLEYGPDLSLRNSDGWTPLLIAARYGDDETVKMLLENGADINDKNNNNSGILHLVIQNEQISSELIKKILENVDINAVKNTGYTALMSATRLNMLEKVKLLLENGADVFIRNNISSQTALDLCSTDQCKGLLSKYMWDRIYQNIKRLSRQYSRSGTARFPKDVWELILLRNKQKQLCKTLSNDENKNILINFALLLDIPVNEDMSKRTLCDLVSKQLSYGGKYSQKSVNYLKNKNVIQNIINSAQMIGVNTDQSIDKILNDISAALMK